MTTRTHCDHCGNVVRDNFAVYEVVKVLNNSIAFVPNNNVINNPGGGYGVAGGGYGVAGILLQTAPVTAASKQEVLKIDLCQHCEPIWLTRIKKLTLETGG